MAFNGYLVKVGDYEIPLEYMNEASYKCTWSTLDLDSTRNANGVLERNAILQLPHCSFDTRPLTNVGLMDIWSNIRSRYTDSNEKKVSASVYVPETDSYYSGSFYVPDTEITINHIYGNTVYYNSVTFEFIGYGEA